MVVPAIVTVVCAIALCVFYCTIILSGQGCDQHPLISPYHNRITPTIMTENILTASVTTVEIGQNISIDGLKTECGQYAISVQQVARLFQVPRNNAQRTFESLLGKDRRFFKVRVKNSPTKKSENGMLLDDFRKLTLLLARKNNKTADRLVYALFGLSLEQLFADAFNVELSRIERQQIVDRILDKPCPYEALYSKETCTKGFTWFGSSFYWKYFYNWMNQEEKAKHEESNPVVNGQRRYRIHQWIEPDTKNRLRDKAIELGVLIRQSNNRDQFQNNFQAMYGSGYQLDLF